MTTYWRRRAWSRKLTVVSLECIFIFTVINKILISLNYEKEWFTALCFLRPQLRFYLQQGGGLQVLLLLLVSNLGESQISEPLEHNINYVVSRFP